MHSHNIVHRDLKPENILLESEDPDNLNIKITDFGFACFFNPKEQGLREVLGSPLYMAPEIIQEQPYNHKVDIWSIGVITYILLSGRPPFKGQSKNEIFRSIMQGSLSFDNPIWDVISAEAKDFIVRALHSDPSKRATAKNLLDHPWLYRQINEVNVKDQVQLEVANNLKQFRNATVFQSGVLSCIVGLKTTSEEIEELKNLFLALDTSKDGTLSIEEIKAGFETLRKKFKGSRLDYHELMQSMDKDGNGVIDYQEFITAAIDKAALLNKKNLISAF